MSTSMPAALIALLFVSFPSPSHAANTGPAAAPPAVHDDAEQTAGANARYDEGEGFARSGDWKKAESAYRTATTLRADFPEAWNGLGHALKMQGKFPDAVEAYQRALALRPEFPQALEYLGQAYVAMGRLDEARATLGKLRGLDPDLTRKLEVAIDDGKPVLGW